MVNEAYLNRLNGILPLHRSANDEVRQIDSLDPLSFRIDRQRADRERDPVRNTAFLGVQLEQPGLAGQYIRQRPLPELEQRQRQHAAEQRSIDQVVQQVIETEPKRP